jgi:hypothetical protein
MRLYDPFPLEKLPLRVRRVIVAKFGGQCPSVRDVVSIPDAHWLKLPGMGPKSFGRLWLVAQNVQRNARISPLSGMTEAELQAEYDRLSDQRKAIDDKLKAVRTEFLSRLSTKQPSLRRSCLIPSIRRSKASP